MKRPLPFDLVADEKISPDAMERPTKLPSHTKVPDNTTTITATAITKLPLDAFELIIDTPGRLARMALVCLDIHEWIQPTITKLEPTKKNHCKGCWGLKGVHEKDQLRYYCATCLPHRGLVLPFTLVCPEFVTAVTAGTGEGTLVDATQSLDLGTHHPYSKVPVTTALVIANLRGLLLEKHDVQGTAESMETEYGKKLREALDMTKVALERLGFQSESRGRSDKAHRVQVLKKISGNIWNPKELIVLDLPSISPGH
jgi:hypothetical protein